MFACIAALLVATNRFQLQTFFNSKVRNGAHTTSRRRTQEQDQVFHSYIFKAFIVHGAHLKKSRQISFSDTICIKSAFAFGKRTKTSCATS
jgi:hypothetical protein